MSKSYADLLREAREQIPEVTVQEVADLAPGSATIVDVREASEWEQGHVPGAQHVSKSYIEQQIEAIAPDRSTITLNNSISTVMNRKVTKISQIASQNENPSISRVSFEPGEFRKDQAGPGGGPNLQVTTGTQQSGPEEIRGQSAFMKRRRRRPAYINAL